MDKKTRTKAGKGVRRDSDERNANAKVINRGSSNTPGARDRGPGSGVGDDEADASDERDIRAEAVEEDAVTDVDKSDGVKTGAASEAAARGRRRGRVCARGQQRTADGAKRASTPPGTNLTST